MVPENQVDTSADMSVSVGAVRADQVQGTDTQTDVGERDGRAVRRITHITTGLDTAPTAPYYEGVISDNQNHNDIDNNNNNNNRICIAQVCQMTSCSGDSSKVSTDSTTDVKTSFMFFYF